MSTYSYDQLIDKTIYAQKDVKLYRLPEDNAAPIFTVKAGQPVGTLYSVLNPKSGRSGQWLMFYDSTARAYYMPVTPNTVNESELKKQGAKTTEQITKEAEEAQQIQTKGAVRYYFEKYFPLIILAAVAVPIAKALINKQR